MEKNEKLWKIARKRAAFKRHLYTYLVVNSFLWLIWLYRGSGHIWPIYPTLGWGLGLAFGYADAYYGDKDDLAEKEYRKLVEKENRK
jgi:hypothetical protein